MKTASTTLFLTVQLVGAVLVACTLLLVAAALVWT